MLGIWRIHSDYQQFVQNELSALAKVDHGLLYEYEDLISKLYFLDLEPLKEVIAHLYSVTGRPSHYQPEIFRAFIIMNALGIPLDKWVDKVSNNPVLRIISGFDQDHVSKVASYYDFIDRIYKFDDKPIEKDTSKKPKKRPKKGEKLPPKHAGVVDKLVEHILKGRRFDHRPELKLQEIFARVCVDKSIDLGILKDSLHVSGDGTPINTGASPIGRKTCNCHKNGIYNCACPRRFSDPYASWGWDSHNEHYFYGYSGYFLSAYNCDSKTDIPLYLRFVDAKRHDSISAVVALAEFRDLHPEINVLSFLSDSASDNYATYNLLNQWNINAIIALNDKRGRKPSYPEYISLSEHGVPLCPAGRKMIHHGSSRTGRIRTKWRCPRVVKKLCFADECYCCSDSTYGRTIYTKPDWDIRLFTSIPRGTDAFKNLMKQRTAVERINNRILNHYGIELTKQRGKKRISFFATLAAINIHLDAWISKFKSDGVFSFEGTFGIIDAA